jgi:hypothetical protein
VSVFFGREYNYAEWARSVDEMAYFKTLAHAGDAAPDVGTTGSWWRAIGTVALWPCCRA